MTPCCSEYKSEEQSNKAHEMIMRLRAEGKLSALPIGPVNWADMTVRSIDGRTFRAYGISGTWVEAKPYEEGDIRYLGSASHAGKIEFKALFVLIDGCWHNILNGNCEMLDQSK